MTIKNIWVIAETREGLAQLCSGGHQLGEEVSAVVLGAKIDAEKAISAGADRVYWLGEQNPEHIYENYCETICEIVMKELPGLVLVQASRRGSLVAGRLAAKLGTSVLVDASGIDVKDGRVPCRHMIYGGAAFRTEKALTGTAVAIVPAGEYAAMDEDDTRKGEIIEVPFVEPSRGFKLVVRNRKTASQVNLNAARRVVGIGRGLAQESDLKIIEELASALEAEVGCSRPLAEGVNWLPKERYIGISGAMIKPDVYLAIGISGQVQHMVGASLARSILAINSDKNSVIFKQCDYGIVGDLYKIVPALTAKLRGNG